MRTDLDPSRSGGASVRARPCVSCGLKIGEGYTEAAYVGRMPIKERGRPSGGSGCPTAAACWGGKVRGGRATI